MSIGLRSQQSLTGLENYSQLHSRGGCQGVSSSQHGHLHRPLTMQQLASPQSEWSRKKKKSNWNGNNSIFSNFGNDIPPLLPNLIGHRRTLVQVGEDYKRVWIPVCRDLEGWLPQMTSSLIFSLFVFSNIFKVIHLPKKCCSCPNQNLKCSTFIIQFQKMFNSPLLVL